MGTPSLSNEIECILCDSAIIYKSDIDLSLNKHFLIFLPLRLGLDSLNNSYIESIKHCFHLKECIGIIGGKPQKPLYFIGYQEDKLFSLDAKQLDPSMAIAFFIKPHKKEIDSFWRDAAK